MFPALREAALPFASQTCLGAGQEEQLPAPWRTFPPAPKHPASRTRHLPHPWHLPPHARAESGAALSFCLAT